MKSTSNARSPFPWFGGKQKLADEILGLFPEHAVYVEVFGGGASVLLSKPPATLDVYNDRDDGLVNFFEVLRDQPERLVAMLELTPYSRREWQRARATWFKVDDPVERARRWYVVASQSFGAMVARDSCAGWKQDVGCGWGGERLGRMHLSRAASTANRIDHIWRFVERMRLVQIEALDWRECLERYDNEDCLFYLDPPYVPSTRRAGGYVHELTLEDHAELVERVLALQGVAIISGYHHDVYAPLVTGGGLHAQRVRRHLNRRAAIARSRTRPQERSRLGQPARRTPDAVQPRRGRGVIEVVPISRDAARAFVREHHRHNPGHAGAEVLRVGLAVDGELIAVGIAGMPCRELMDGFTLEITRVCTLGHENACSRIYGQLARAAKATGWRRLFTYTLVEESGASVRAAGFYLDGEVPARDYLAKNGSRPRYDTNLLGESVVPDGPKLRWRRDLVPVQAGKRSPNLDRLAGA